MNSGGHPPLFASAEILTIHPADVFVPERIGFLHEDKAVALGRLMAVYGQRDPIKVVAHNGLQSWRLVTGRHRLRGAELEGLPVYALEVIGKAEDLAELEASENLHRRPLGPIERASFVQALCQAAQERIAREHGELSKQKLGAKIRWDRVRQSEETPDSAIREESEDARAKMAQACGWHESVADALDLGRTTIKRSLRLHRLLIEPFPELIEPLSKHPVVGESDSQLREIADFGDPADLAPRRRLIETILDDPELSVSAAKALIGARSGAAQSPRRDLEKHFNAIKGGWSRLGIAERNRFVREDLPGMLTPAQKRDLRDRLNEELGDA